MPKDIEYPGHTLRITTEAPERCGEAYCTGHADQMIVCSCGFHTRWYSSPIDDLNLEFRLFALEHINGKIL